MAIDVNNIQTETSANAPASKQKSAWYCPSKSRHRKVEN